MHFQNVYVKLNHAMRSRGVVALGHGRRGQGGHNQVPTTLSQGAAAVIHSRRGKGGRGRGGATASAATLDHEHDVTSSGRRRYIGLQGSFHPPKYKKKQWK